MKEELFVLNEAMAMRLTKPWFQLKLRPEHLATMSLKDRLKAQRWLRAAQAELEKQTGMVRPPRRLP